MKPGKILVVGGYGSVGKTIALLLAKEFPGQVIAAGRRASPNYLTEFRHRRIFVKRGA